MGINDLFALGHIVAVAFLVPVILFFMYKRSNNKRKNIHIKFRNKEDEK